MSNNDTAFADYENLIRRALDRAATAIHIRIDGGALVARLRVAGRIQPWDDIEAGSIERAVQAGFAAAVHTELEGATPWSPRVPAIATTEHQREGGAWVRATLSSHPLINDGCAVVIQLAT